MGQILEWKKYEDDEVLVESAWERKMHLLGSLSYDSKMLERPATERASGMKFLQDNIRKVEAKIREFQSNTILERNNGTARTERTVRGTVIIVPADTLALLTMKPLLDKTTSAPHPEQGASYSIISRLVGKAVETELNFRNWIATSQEEADQFAIDHGMTHSPVSMAERLVSEHGVTERTLRRWRKSFQELTRYKWSDLQEYYAGDALLNAAIEAMPHAFEIVWPFIRQQKRKSVKITDSFAQKLTDDEIKHSASQTVKKPMLTKPKPWVKVE